MDEAVAEERVLPRALALAAELADKDAATLGARKRGLYGATLAVFEGPEGLPPELR